MRNRAMGLLQARRGGTMAMMTGAVLAAAAWGVVLPGSVLAQASPPGELQPAPQRTLVLAPDLAGRPIEDVRITGNRVVSASEILNVVRSKVGDPLDPQPVTEDYQRTFGF